MLRWMLPVRLHVIDLDPSKCVYVSTGLFSSLLYVETVCVLKVCSCVSDLFAAVLLLGGGATESRHCLKTNDMKQADCGKLTAR